MRKYANTEAFNLTFQVNDPDPPYQTRDANMELQRTNDVWGNYSMKPGLRGFRGSFSSTSHNIAATQRTYPHGTRSSPGSMRSCVDGSVESFALE